MITFKQFIGQMLLNEGIRLNAQDIDQFPHNPEMGMNFEIDLQRDHNDDFVKLVRPDSVWLGENRITRILNGRNFNNKSLFIAYKINDVDPIGVNDEAPMGVLR